MGGTGAFLALASLALPLALAIVLHVVSPRGSRESLSYRLKHTGQGGLAVLLLVMLVVSTFLVGLMAGPWFCPPFVLGMAAVGLPRPAGSRFLSFCLLSLLVASLGLGAALSVAWPNVVGGQPPFATVSGEFTRLMWTESLPLLRDFPLVGTGLGSFATIYPYVKTHDASLNTAMSTLLQCGVESGVAGLSLLVMAALWCLFRLPFCLKRVGAADRTLAYGLLGAALGFSVWSVLHWTVELPAVAISASALGGTCNRWLAGGTDLFVERSKHDRSHGRAQGGVDPRMPESTCLHIQDQEAGPIRVVDIPWISVRIGRAAFCEVRLSSDDLADEACRLYRRGRSWHLVPVGSKGKIMVEGRSVNAACPVPFDVPFRVGNHCLTIRQDRTVDPDWQMYPAHVAEHRERSAPLAEERAFPMASGRTNDACLQFTVR